jgi:hypothetical protein
VVRKNAEIDIPSTSSYHEPFLFGRVTYVDQSEKTTVKRHLEDLWNTQILNQLRCD